MSTPKVKLFCVLALTLLTAAFAAAQTVPDGRLDYYEFATDPELVRYAEAACTVIEGVDLVPTPGDDFLLLADPWVLLNGCSQLHPCEVPLCPDIRFFGQPSAGLGAVGGNPFEGRGGSCILVAPDLVLTAGHLVSSDAQCHARRFIFDFAQFVGPGGGSPSEPGTVPVSAEDVFDCAEFVATGLVEGFDWTLVRLDRPVVGHRPLDVRRSGEPAIGTPVANLGHPDRLPLKAEASEVVSLQAAYVRSPLHTRNGSSGSMLVNRLTGKVEGNARFPAFPYRERPGAGCWEPCLDASCLPNVAFTKIGHATNWIPPLGLEIQPLSEDVVEQVGPVGGPFTNDTVGYELSVGDSEAAAIPFAVGPADPSPWVATVLEAPPLGELEPGENAALVVTLGNEAYGLGAGRVDGTISVRDEIYEANEFKHFRLSVGYDGFTVAPDEPFAGDGPGAQPGETKSYALENRYLVPLDVRISATEPWIRIDGGSGPEVVTLPAGGGSDIGPIFQVVESYDLPNGVHTGTIRFEQLPENGESIERDVRFDVGRRFYSALGLPRIIGQDPVAIPITIPQDFELLDLDVEIELLPGASNSIGQIELVSPSGTSLPLAHLVLGHHVWDDDTNPPPGGTLALFEGEPAAGTWILHVAPLASGTLILNRMTLRATPVGWQ